MANNDVPIARRLALRGVRASPFGPVTTRRATPFGWVTPTPARWPGGLDPDMAAMSDPRGFAESDAMSPDTPPVSVVVLDQAVTSSPTAAAL